MLRNQSGRSVLRIIILAAVVLGIVAAAGAYLALTNLDTLIARYKPNLESSASQAVGAPVHLGKVQTSIFPGIGAKISEIDVGEADAITVNSVELKIRLWPLLRKRLEIEALEIHQPSLSIEKTAAGVLIHGIPAKDPAKPSRQAPGGSERSKGAESNQAPSALDIQVQRLAVRDGTLHLKEFAAGITQTVSQLNFSAAVELAGSTTALSAVEFQADLKEVGPVSVDIDRLVFDGTEQQVAAAGLSAEILSSPLQGSFDYNLRKRSGDWVLQSKGIQLGNLHRLRTLAPALGILETSGTVSADLRGSVTGSLISAAGSLGISSVSLRQGAFTVAGLSAPCSVAIKDSLGEFSCPEFKLTLNDAPLSGKFTAQLAQQNARIAQFELNGFEGVTTASADYGLIDKSLSSAGRIGAVQLAPVLGVFVPSLKNRLEGLIPVASWDIKAIAGEEMRKSLNGSSALEMKNGRIVGFNLLASVLQSLRQLPFVTTSLEESLPDAARAALRSPDTAISQARISARLRGGSIESQEVLVESDLFSMTGRFTLSPAQELDAELDFAIAASMAPLIIGKVKELEALRTAAGLLAIPIAVKGTLPDVQVLPRIDVVSRLVMAQLAKDKGHKIIEKALGKGAGEKLRNILKF